MKHWEFIPHEYGGHIYLFKSYRGIRGTAEEKGGVIRGKLSLDKYVVTFETIEGEELKKSFEECVDNYLQTCKQLGKLPDTYEGVTNE